MLQDHSGHIIYCAMLYMENATELYYIVATIDARRWENEKRESFNVNATSQETEVETIRINFYYSCGGTIT